MQRHTRAETMAVKAEECECEETLCEMRAMGMMNHWIYYYWTCGGICKGLTHLLSIIARALNRKLSAEYSSSVRRRVKKMDTGLRSFSNSYFVQSSLPKGVYNGRNLQIERVAGQSALAFRIGMRILVRSLPFHIMFDATQIGPQ